MAFTIIMAIVWSIVCSGMAQRRHRDPSLGAIGGLIFGLLAVLYYLIAGDKYFTTLKDEDWSKQIKGDE